MKHFCLFLFALMVVFPFSVNAETVIARWDFDDENKIVDEGAGTFTPNSLSGEDFHAGNGGFAIAYVSWGDEFVFEDDFVVISISSLNLYQLKISFDSYHSPTGPTQLCVLASVNNFNTYSQLTDQPVGLSDTWHTIPSINCSSEFSNQSSVKIRIYGYQSSRGTGRMRLDNILITGETEESLPVQCSSFKAVYEDEQVKLSWKTQSEVNVMGYHILRSETEGGTYQSITDQMIPSQGNGSTATDYEFIDQNLEPGQLPWYKIEVLSSDQSRQIIGPIQTVKAMSSQIQKFELLPCCPNPFNPTTMIHYSLPDQINQSEISLKIYNMFGQEVFRFNPQNMHSGDGSLFWNGCDQNGRQVASGLYIVQLSSPFDEFALQKVVKIH